MYATGSELSEQGYSYIQKWSILTQVRSSVNGAIVISENGAFRSRFGKKKKIHTHTQKKMDRELVFVCCPDELGWQKCLL